ncbi:MAG: hypothetical protein ACFFAS_20670 [Promethearchaeota archaeon]
MTTWKGWTARRSSRNWTSLPSKNSGGIVATCKRGRKIATTRACYTGALRSPC